MKIPFFFESWCVPNCATFDVFGLNFAPERTTQIREACFWVMLGSQLQHRCAHLGSRQPKTLGYVLVLPITPHSDPLKGGLFVYWGDPLF